MRYFIGLFMLFAFSCSDKQQEKHPDKKHSGLYIENGPRQGLQYFDSLGIEYKYRYVTTTIINDSIVPIQLKISLSKDYNYPFAINSTKFRVFLLPRKLTPEKQ